MGSAVDNGSSAKWKRIRLQILRRDGYMCQQCGQTDGQLHIDHIIPRRLQGTDDESNLRTLCQKCNLSKGGRFFGTANTPPTLHDLNIPNNVSVSHD